MNKQIVIVSPALANANNGNWQTAHRWQTMLQQADTSGQTVRVRIVTQWPDSPAAANDAVMLALHARRSAASIAAWSQQRGQGLAVILTGTDLYRDIHTDAQAQQSLHHAQILVVLQELGIKNLPLELHQRTRVIFQSTSARQSLPKPQRFFKAVMVGHLRDEKSPQTLFAAAQMIKPSDAVHINHIGAGLDLTLTQSAQATALACPHYRWLGGLTHEATRRHIQRAHVLVHCSRMEGGAHVIMEAVRSGTPVLASRVDGNVGMLGADYLGYFDWNQADQLVNLMRRCRDDATFYAALCQQCHARSKLFSPESERDHLRRLVTDLLVNPQ